MRTFRIITFGCKVNQYDSQQWRAMLAGAGLRESADDQQCDLLLVNTCTVTAAAEQQARQTIRKIKIQNQTLRHCSGQECKIVVAGCYGQVGEKALREITQVDLVVGRFNEDAVSAVRKELGLTGKPFSEGISGFAGHTRAFLKVQDGCNHRCSYCIVPLARGKSRSRPLAEVIAEAQRLARAGHKELVLTGVRLGDFKPSLRALLKSLESVDGVERLRLSSLEPDDLDQDTIEALAESRKTARHLHLPLQSGDDRILKLMKRPYTMSYFSNLLDAVRRAIPEMTFGTDIIAGFPGESEEQFNHSYQAVRDLPITHLHAFAFSKRRGTAAALMGGQIPGTIKKERSLRLRSMFEMKQQRYWRSLIESATPVLFETNAGGGWLGLSEHYFRVRAVSSEDLGNQLRAVKLTGMDENGMTGKLVS